MSSASSIPSASDLGRALEFIREQFRLLRQEGVLRADEAGAIDAYYKTQLTLLDAGQATDSFRLPSADVCWDCRAPVAPAQQFCPQCCAPVNTERVERLRQYILLCHEIQKHEAAGRLRLAVTHQCMAGANGRIVALRKRLSQDRPPEVVPAARSAEPAAVPAEPVAVRAVPVAVPAVFVGPPRSLLEMLIDPKTIQWLLGIGGVLLVVGAVIYLIAAGIFQDPELIAVVLGAGNGALLLGGWWVTRKTRYELAGRALTLLACLLLPFNLWFYDAQGLIVLNDGGHLWLAALVCCVLYVLSAWVTCDPVLPHVIVAGVALTGLLLLADRHIHRLWEVTSPVTLLVVLGLLSIHAERLFPEGDGPFSRRRFGLQFFFAGQAVLGAGLLFLLGAQVFGGVLYPLLRGDFGGAQVSLPEVVTTSAGRAVALCLVLAATYGYLYSDLVVRKVGVYLFFVVFTVLWSEVLAVSLIPWPIPVAEVVILSLALTALGVNLASNASAGGAMSVFARAAPPLGLILSTVPVLLGVGLRLAAWSTGGEWHYYLRSEPDALGVSYIVTMVLTALACRIGAYLYRHQKPWLSQVYFFGTAAATLAAADTLLLVLRPDLRWDAQAPLLMIVPLLYLIAARLYRGHSAEQPLLLVARVAVGAMMFFSLGTAFRGFLLVSGETLNLNLAAFFAEAILFFVLDAAFNRRSFSILAATFMACAVAWQLLRYADVGTEDVYILTLAGLGLVLLAAYRFALLERLRRAGLPTTSFVCANALLLLALGAGFLLTLGRLMDGRTPSGDAVGLPLGLAGCAVVAALLAAQADWRRVYVASALAHGVLAALTLAFLSHLTVGEKLEIAVIVGGVALLAAGHAGWYREADQENDTVTTCLILGSLMVALPLVITVVGLRLKREQTGFDWFHALNEMGMLAAGLLLFAGGCACRIRATTITGAVLLILNLLTLVLFVRIPEKLQSVAVYMLVGGGVVFGLGLLLSFFRERLLALPSQIRRREGVFRVLNWR